MATFLKLVCGSTTFDLNDTTNYAVMTYTPQHEPEHIERVSEMVSILVFGSSKSNLDANRSALLAMLHNITLRQDNQTVARVFVQFYPDSLSSQTWQSELFDFRVVDEENVYESPYDNLCIQLDITWTRDNGWDSTTETYLALTNGNGTNVTSGINVYPCNDGVGSSPNKRNNWVSIAAASITGNLPAKCRIEITNMHASGSIRQVWIGHNWVDPSNITELFEAENNEVFYSHGADANSSGGEYTITPIVTTSDDEVPAFWWTLSAAQVAAWKGSWVHAFVRFASAQTLTAVKANRFRTRLSMYDYFALDLTGQGYVATAEDTRFLDLGAFRLPPWLPNESNLASLVLELCYIGGPTTPGEAFDIDYLMLLPADGFRALDTASYRNGTLHYVIPQNSRIVDDGILDLTYMDAGDGTGKVSIISPVGGKAIRLQPNKDQRIFFLTNNHGDADADNVQLIANILSVRIAYRPRRLVV